MISGALYCFQIMDQETCSSNLLISDTALGKAYRPGAFVYVLQTVQVLVQVCLCVINCTGVGLWSHVLDFVRVHKELLSATECGSFHTQLSLRHPLLRWEMSRAPSNEAPDAIGWLERSDLHFVWAFKTHRGRVEQVRRCTPPSCLHGQTDPTSL